MGVFICDHETGEILHEATSKYRNEVRVVENAARWCRRHGYTIVDFSFNGITSRLHGVWVKKIEEEAETKKGEKND